MLALCRNFPGIFGNQQQHYMEVIKRMLVQCMQDQANPQVGLDLAFCLALDRACACLLYVLFLTCQIRTLAARAAASFVLTNERNTTLLKQFSDLLPGILQVHKEAFMSTEMSL